MSLGFSLRHIVLVLAASLLIPTAHAARKPHVVGLGAFKRVPYSKEGDPEGAQVGEKSLSIRPLVVDDQVKEWTTGESHEVTERTLVVRRAIRLNDSLPGEKTHLEHWVWQRGPWLMVDRVSGHVTALKLPDYEPGVSQVAWFRDYGAYCGLTASGKQLYAVVAQLAARKPVLAKKLGEYAPDPTGKLPACLQPDWQRDPLRITFHPVGNDDVIYEIVAGSVVLVEDSGDEDEPAAPSN